MSKYAPMREVTEIRDLTGPLGGRMLVYILACGHTIWQRRPTSGGARTQMRCIPCWVHHNKTVANGG